MVIKRLLIFTLITLFISTFAFAQEKKDNNPSFKFTKEQPVQQMKPKKPLRIKVHRNSKGEYSWDITGDNVDEIIKADTRLKKLLKIE
ncbi:MAG TPA: hypothetical protein HPP56_01745 [Nitrospirae bacterium]|nr:hypothetical protein [Nitrospirota bacterium]